MDGRDTVPPDALLAAIASIRRQMEAGGYEPPAREDDAVIEVQDRYAVMVKAKATGGTRTVAAFADREAAVAEGERLRRTTHRNAPRIELYDRQTRRVIGAWEAA